MKVSEADITAASELNNPAVNKLIEFYNFITENPAYESYVIRMMYHNNWNKELRDKKVDLINIGKGKESDVHDKAVDRARSFFNDQLSFLKDTQAIQAMLTPQQQEQYEKSRKSMAGKDLAF